MNDYLPTEFNLGQNYPNPFKDKTSIKYCVAYKTRVNLMVYDSADKEIEKLVEEEKNPGTYEVVFQLAVGSKQSASEDYYYRLEADEYKSEKRMQIIE